MTTERYFGIGAILGLIVGVVTFIGSWWYCAANFGFLLGFGLGWLPAAIAAVIAGALTAVLWGVVVCLILFLGIWLWYENKQDQDRATNWTKKEDRVEVLDPSCVEQRRPDGSLASYLCGDVVLPIGPSPSRATRPSP